MIPDVDSSGSLYLQLIDLFQTMNELNSHLHLYYYFYSPIRTKPPNTNSLFGVLKVVYSGSLRLVIHEKHHFLPI